MYLTEGTCTLDGTYVDNFTAVCGNITNCPNTNYQEAHGFAYTLKSENFCAEITVDVGIVGNIRSYDNATFDAYPPKNGFTVEKRAFYLVKVNSDLNTPKNLDQTPSADLYVVGGVGTVVAFSSVRVKQVTLKLLPSLSSIRIFSNFLPVDFFAAGYPADYKTDCKQVTAFENGTILPQNMIGFSFLFSREIATANNLVKNGKVSFIVIADIRANYADSTNKKRMMLATNGEDGNSFSGTFEVNDDGADTTGSTTTTTTGGSTTGGSTTGVTTTTTTSGGSSSGAATSTSNAFTFFASIIMIVVALLI
jgi:hypothetical protein